MVLEETVKNKLASRAGKGKSFIRRRKPLCYWIQISIHCYPLEILDNKKTTLLETEKANEKQSQRYNEYTLFLKSREIQSTNSMLLLSFLFKCVYELNVGIFIRLSLSQLKLTESPSFATQVFILWPEKINLNTGSKRTGNQISSLFEVSEWFKKVVGKVLTFIKFLKEFGGQKVLRHDARNRDP